MVWMGLLSMKSYPARHRRQAPGVGGRAEFNHKERRELKRGHPRLAVRPEQLFAILVFFAVHADGVLMRLPWLFRDSPAEALPLGSHTVKRASSTNVFPNRWQALENAGSV